VLRVDDPVGDLVHGRVEDGISGETCGGWFVGRDGFIHVFLDDDVDWGHQLARYRLVLTRGGEAYWKEHDDELADKLLFISENFLVTEHNRMEEVVERYGLEGIPDIYVKFEELRRPVIVSNGLDKTSPSGA